MIKSISLFDLGLQSAHTCQLTPWQSRGQLLLLLSLHKGQSQSYTSRGEQFIAGNRFLLQLEWNEPDRLTGSAVFNHSPPIARYLPGNIHHSFDLAALVIEPMGSAQVQSLPECSVPRVISSINLHTCNSLGTVSRCNLSFFEKQSEANRE